MTEYDNQFETTKPFKKSLRNNTRKMKLLSNNILVYKAFKYIKLSNIRMGNMTLY